MFQWPVYISCASWKCFWNLWEDLYFYISDLSTSFIPCMWPTSKVVRLFGCLYQQRNIFLWKVAFLCDALQEHDGGVLFKCICVCFSVCV